MHVMRPSILILSLLVLCSCTSGRTAFVKAEKLEREGNLDAALVKYAEVASANPEVGEYRVRFLKVTDAAARAHMKKGDLYLAAKDYDAALREYQSAYAIDPSQAQAKQVADQTLKLRNAQTYYLEGAEFEKTRKVREAVAAYQQALDFNPSHQEAKEGVERLLKTRRQKLDGFELNLKSNKPITLKFKDAKLKEIFSILSQLSGINFVFDDAVKDVNLSLYLENATFQQAMEIITGMNKLGRKVLNESTIVLYPKNPEKNKQYEDLFLQTFYLNKLDAKKAVNLIRTMLQVKKIYVNEEMNALVLRDTPEVIEVARKILEANDVPDAEVILDVEVFELSKQNAEAFGMALSRYAISAAVVPPSSTSGAFFADTLTSTTTTNTSTTGAATTTTSAGPSNLLNFFSYRNFNGYLTVPNATFNFGKTLANGETLSNPKIRVKNREKAKFNVGTRVPITTTSSPTGGGVSVNVQYVDVGVKVNAEPTIQLNNEVTIKLGLEVSSILAKDTVGTDQATTVVTIGTKNLDTVLSLKDGETSIIGGLISKSKNDSKSKVFLLGDIPFLGALFTNNNDSASKNELMLAITPRIIRAVTVPDTDVAAFWSGREDDPSTQKPYASFNQEPEFNTPGEAPAVKGAAVGLPAPSPAPVPAGPSHRTLRRPGEPAAPAAAAPAPVEAPAPRQPQVEAKAAAPVQAAVSGQAAALPALPPPAAAAPSGVPAPPALPTPSAPGAAAGAVAKAAPQLPVPPPQGSTQAAAPGPQQAAAKVVLGVEGPPSVKVNQQFTIQVIQTGARNLYNAVFALTYNPKVLEVVSQTEGPFMKQGNAKTSFQAFMDRKKGELWVALSRVETPSGATGSGTLASVSFRAIGAGAAGIGLANPNFTTQQGERLEVTPYNPVVEVR